MSDVRIQDGLLFVDGQPVGEVHEADDGALLLVDGQGQVIDAVSADGTQQLDPADYGPAQPQDFVTRQEFDMAQRIAALEAQGAPEPQVDPELVTQQLEAKIADIARDYGRDELTSKEFGAILTEASGQLERGEQLDFDTAALRAGLQHVDTMSGQERRNWAIERQQERGEAENPKPTVPSELPLDANHEERTRWATAKLEGRVADPESDSEPAPEAA